MKVQLPRPPLDPLSESLQLSRMSSTLYSRCYFTSPWGLELPSLPGMLMFHVVTVGHCWLSVDRTVLRLLQRGDFVLVPRGTGHALLSHPGADTVPLFEMPKEYLIHGDPSHPWTLASLAEEVAMSRSAFATRFAELVDMPVMQYVTQWRMQVAMNLLQTGGTRIADLAARLGYQSEAAFSRAFKRATGMSPGGVRRRPRLNPTPSSQPPRRPKRAALPELAATNAGVQRLAVVPI